MEDPLRFLVHDITFHRTVAAASGNPIIASLVEMVSTLYYERRRRTAERASDRDLRDAAEMHRRIYQAIRSRDADAARLAMNDHLMQAAAHQSKEPAPEDSRRAAAAAPPVPPIPDPQRVDRRRIRRARSAGMNHLREAPAGQASMFDLTGRVAVVVGGTSGIGRALAIGLADAGADVVATGRREALVDEVASAIEATGRRTLRQAADVGDAASLEALRDACLERFGAHRHPRDAPPASPSVCRRSTWTTPTGSRIIETNLTGTMRACRVVRAADDRRAAADGIITIASLASFVGLFEVAAYTASKAAVAGLTRALAVEWAPPASPSTPSRPACSGRISITALLDSPRGQEFLTRTPMRRFGQIEELVGAAVFLASDAASFVTGHVLAVDGGFLASGVNQ